MNDLKERLRHLCEVYAAVHTGHELCHKAPFMLYVHTLDDLVARGAYEFAAGKFYSWCNTWSREIAQIMEQLNDF